MYSKLGHNKPSSVPLSGSNTKIFNRNDFNTWDKNRKFKIVTHHWGSNWNKGFDAYKKLDDLLIDNF